MNKHIIPTLIVLLLVSTAFVGLSQNIDKALQNYSTKPVYSGKTIIVDNEGDGDYKVIQDAIDNSNVGDIILVYSGNYSEISFYYKDPSKRKKNISLIGIPYELGEGNDVGKPIIFGEKRLIFLSYTNGCVIEGFELKKGDHGILMWNSSNNLIKNNTIKSCQIGIELEVSSNNNILEENQIISCYDEGIFIESTSNNIIKKNIIEKCDDWGIYIFSGKRNKIIQNKIVNNGKPYFTNDIFDLEGGIVLIVSSFNIIEKNHFDNNYKGIIIDYSFFNIISQNNFIKNQENDAFFIFSLSTLWYRNFWGRARFLPKPIIGIISVNYPPIPWIQFDWRPALRPYDI